MNNSCKGCTDRKVGCHAECERYKQWKKEYNEQAKIIKRNRHQYQFQSEPYSFKKKW